MQNLRNLKRERAEEQEQGRRAPKESNFKMVKEASRLCLHCLKKINA